MQRPLDRIGSILPKLSHLWHYYPGLSLAELVQEVTTAANSEESDYPQTTLYDIEDIAYPEGHFHAARNLEMGIKALEIQHVGQPLPPPPIQTALMGKAEKAWRKQPQIRLGQLLSNAHFLAELENTVL